MTNDEFPMTKEVRNPTAEIQTRAARSAAVYSVFGLGHSFGIRPSDFVIIQSLLVNTTIIDGSS